FAVALVLGPLLGDWFGLAGLFWFTAGMALLGIPVTLWVVPTPAHSQPNRGSGGVRNELVAALRNEDLLRLDIGILTLHMGPTGRGGGWKTNRFRPCAPKTGGGWTWGPSPGTWPWRGGSSRFP